MPNFRFFQAQESDPSGMFQQYARSGEAEAAGITEAGRAIAGAFERNLAMREMRRSEGEKFNREQALLEMRHRQALDELGVRDRQEGARMDREYGLRSEEAARERDFRYDLEDMQAERAAQRDMTQGMFGLAEQAMRSKTADQPYREREERERRAVEARTAAMHLFASKDSSPVFSAKVPPKAMGALTRRMKPEDFDAYVGGMYDPENAKTYQKSASTAQDVSWIDEDEWAKHGKVFGNRWGQEGLDALEEARKAYGHEIGIEQAYKGAFGRFEKEIGGLPAKSRTSTSGASGSETRVPIEGAPTVEQFQRLQPKQQAAILDMLAARALRSTALEGDTIRWAGDPQAKAQAQQAARAQVAAMYGMEEASEEQTVPTPQAGGGDAGDIDEQIRAAQALGTEEGQRRARELFMQSVAGKQVEASRASRSSAPHSIRDLAEESIRNLQNRTPPR